MDKLKVEDFYDWHPKIQMACESFYNIHNKERITIALYSNYIKGWKYSVVKSSYGGILYWNFNSLNDAVDFYNKRIGGFEEV